MSTVEDYRTYEYVKSVPLFSPSSPQAVGVTIISAKP